MRRYFELSQREKEHSHKAHKVHGATLPGLNDIDECWWSLEDAAAVVPGG
ncbi:hypothetical protein KAR48_14260 [bacterium]|nr:hypothetical protein [bacterium]